MTKQTTLQKVLSELQSRTGELRQVAQESGLSYDTVLRIKNQEGDPSYGRVQTLHDYFFSKKPAAKENA